MGASIRAHSKPDPPEFVEGATPSLQHASPKSKSTLQWLKPFGNPPGKIDQSRKQEQSWVLLQQRFPQDLVVLILTKLQKEQKLASILNLLCTSKATHKLFSQFVTWQNPHELIAGCVGFFHVTKFYAEQFNPFTVAFHVKADGRYEATLYAQDAVRRTGQESVLIEGTWHLQLYETVRNSIHFLIRNLARESLTLKKQN